MKRIGSVAPVLLSVIVLAPAASAGAGPAAKSASEAPAASAGPDADLLRRNKVDLTTDALIGVVQRACGKDVPADEIAAGVTKLASPRYAVREAAAGRLTEMGPVAVPALRRAMASDDAELAKRSRELADRIVDAARSPTLAPAVRVLTGQRERAAVEPLVNTTAQ